MTGLGLVVLGGSCYSSSSPGSSSSSSSASSTSAIATDALLAGRLLLLLLLHLALARAVREGCSGRARRRCGLVVGVVVAVWHGGA